MTTYHGLMYKCSIATLSLTVYVCLCFAQPHSCKTRGRGKGEEGHGTNIWVERGL